MRPPKFCPSEFSLAGQCCHSICAVILECLHFIIIVICYICGILSSQVTTIEYVLYVSLKNLMTIAVVVTLKDGYHGYVMK